jgi:ABC-type transport system involved in cytochrome bd biosynthesis fused ATPase/permease subunit
MQMDRILVLDGGKIIDEGTHTDLIARDGLYQKFWNIQAGGFLSEEDTSRTTEHLLPQGSQT